MLIYHEVVLRERRGDHPTAAEYETRFPQWASDIRQQFEIHAGPLNAIAPTDARDGAHPAAGAAWLRNPELLGRGGTAVVYKAGNSRSAVPSRSR